MKKIQESVTRKGIAKRQAHLIRRSHPFAAFGSFLSVETEAFAAFCVAELAVTPSRQALLGIQSLTYDGRTHLRCHFGTRTWHFHHWVRVDGVGPPTPGITVQCTRVHKNVYLRTFRDGRGCCRLEPFRDKKSVQSSNNPHCYIRLQQPSVLQ